jgi:hypothetical protein
VVYVQGAVVYVQRAVVYVQCAVVYAQRALIYAQLFSFKRSCFLLLAFRGPLFLIRPSATISSICMLAPGDLHD